jgi:hypothetical protein
VAPALAADTFLMDNRETGTIHRSGLAGGLVVGYWLVDGYLIGLPVAALAALWNPWIVFAGVLAIVIPINLAACRWIDTAWGTWSTGASGARIQRQLDKVRDTRLGRAMTRWISSDSDARFAAAAALTCAIVAVTLGRSIGGRQVGGHRVRLAALSYALFFAGLFTLIGVLAGHTLRAL